MVTPAHVLTSTTFECPAHFQTAQAFNEYCADIVLRRRSQSGGQNSEAPAFDSQIARLQNVPMNERQDDLIRAPWGGVCIESYDEGSKAYAKFLVVERGTWLALEHHAEKKENLEVKEGSGVLIFQPHPGRPFQTVLLEPDVRISLAPGQQHCIVAATNLLVYETGVDPKGMDQDLIFEHMPDTEQYVR